MADRFKVGDILIRTSDQDDTSTLREGDIVVVLVCEGDGRPRVDAEVYKQYHDIRLGSPWTFDSLYEKVDWISDSELLKEM